LTKFWSPFREIQEEAIVKDHFFKPVFDGFDKSDSEEGHN